MMNSLEAIAERATTEPQGYACELEGARHRLHLWGRFGPDWLGNFCLNLFATDVQIVDAEAMKTRSGPWVASFLLASAVRGPLRHDFLQMARRSPRAIPPLPTPVISIAVRLSREEVGHVYANVVGKDSSGLVAHVLEHFGRFGLRPRRCLIHTRDGEVDDWFWLAPVTKPSSAIVSERTLERDWRNPS
ncbi:MAG: hypothetical protein AAGC67_01635 [Myxococcota bacterium]